MSARCSPPPPQYEDGLDIPIPERPFEERWRKSIFERWEVVEQKLANHVAHEEGLGDAEQVLAVLVEPYVAEGTKKVIIVIVERVRSIGDESLLHLRDNILEGSSQLGQRDGHAVGERRCCC